MHKFLLFGIVGMVLLGTLLTVIQIWAPLMEWGTFIKLIATLAILVVLCGFLLVVGVDFGQNKKLKDENYLD